MRTQTLLLIAGAAVVLILLTRKPAAPVPQPAPTERPFLSLELGRGFGELFGD